MAQNFAVSGSNVMGKTLHDLFWNFFYLFLPYLKYSKEKIFTPAPGKWGGGGRGKNVTVIAKHINRHFPIFSVVRIERA